MAPAKWVICLVLLPDRRRMYKVMQVTETGEEFCAYEGSEYQCNKWIDENADCYPESDFYVRESAPPCGEEDRDAEEDEDA